MVNRAGNPGTVPTCSGLQGRGCCCSGIAHPGGLCAGRTPGLRVVGREVALLDLPSALTQQPCKGQSHTDLSWPLALPSKQAERGGQAGGFRAASHAAASRCCLPKPELRHRWGFARSPFHLFLNRRTSSRGESMHSHGTGGKGGLVPVGWLGWPCRGSRGPACGPELPSEPTGPTARQPEALGVCLCTSRSRTL